MGMLDRHIDLFGKGNAPQVRFGRTIDVSRFPAIDIQNVVDWMSAADTGFDGSRRIPYVVPFDRAWFEFSPHDDAFWKLRDGAGRPFRSLGVYMHTSPPADVDLPQSWREKGCRWVTYLSVYGETSAGTAEKIYTFRMLLDEDRAWLDADAGRLHGTLRSGTKGTRIFHAKLADRLFFATALMHCQNVEAIKLPIPFDLVATRVRHGEHPGVVYKTLMIFSLLRQTRLERRQGESEIERAFAICRGNFAV